MNKALKFVESAAGYLGFAMAGVYLLTHVVVLRSPALEEFIFAYGFQITMALMILSQVAGRLGDSKEVSRGCFALAGLVVCALVIVLVPFELFQPFSLIWLPFVIFFIWELTVALFCRKEVSIS